MLRFGIDLGGTKTEGVILDADGRERFRERLATNATSYMAVLTGIERVYGACATTRAGPRTRSASARRARCRRGPGCCKNSNTTGLNGMPVAQDLRTRLGRDLTIDERCKLLRTRRSASTARGATSASSSASSWVPAAAAGSSSTAGCTPACSRSAASGGTCRSTRTVRRVIAEAAVASRRTSAARASSSATPMRPVSDSPLTRSLRVGARASRAARPPWTPSSRTSAAPWRTSIAVLDPDVIVLGGGLSNVDELYTRGVAEVARRVFSDSLETPIVRNALGDSAGVIGAALVGV